MLSAAIRCYCSQNGKNSCVEEMTAIMNWAITAAFDYQSLFNLSKGLVASLSLFSAMKKHIVDVAEMTAGTLICAEYIRISAHFFFSPTKNMPR